MGSFLLRSTWPESAELRRFFNTNLALLPDDVARGICAALHRRNLWAGHLELVTARLFQLLGAKELRYEAEQATGKRPDLEAVFDDGALIVDAVRPEWDQDLERESRQHEPLIEIVEREIPRGWGYIVDALPAIGPSDSKRGFRDTLRLLFAELPAPTAGTHLPITAEHPQGRIELVLIGGWDHDRAWLMGPASGGWGEAEARVRKALSRKRSQLRGVGFPVLVAIAGGLSETLDDFDIALFGRTIGRLTDRGGVPAGFDPSGLWGRSDVETPIVAGVLAFCHLQYTTGDDPVLYLHPRFSGTLPRALDVLEQRSLEQGGVRVRPAQVRVLFEQLRRAAA